MNEVRCQETFWGRVSWLFRTGFRTREVIISAGALAVIDSVEDRLQKAEAEVEVLRVKLAETEKSLLDLQFEFDTLQRKNSATEDVFEHTTNLLTSVIERDRLRVMAEQAEFTEKSVSAGLRQKRV